MRDDTRPTAMPATMLAGLNIRGSSPTLWNPQVPSLYDVRPSLPLNNYVTKIANRIIMLKAS
jgi:hypothetical protein